MSLHLPLLRSPGAADDRHGSPPGRPPLSHNIAKKTSPQRPQSAAGGIKYSDITDRTAYSSDTGASFEDTAFHIGDTPAARAAVRSKPKQLSSILQRNVAVLRQAVREKDALIAKLVRAEAAGLTRADADPTRDLLAANEKEIRILRGEVLAAQRKFSEQFDANITLKQRCSMALASAEDMQRQLINVQSRLASSEAAVQRNATAMQHAFHTLPDIGDIVAVTPKAAISSITGAVDAVTGKVDPVAVALAHRVAVVVNRSEHGFAVQYMVDGQREYRLQPDKLVVLYSKARTDDAGGGEGGTDKAAVLKRAATAGPRLLAMKGAASPKREIITTPTRVAGSNPPLKKVVSLSDFMAGKIGIEDVVEAPAPAPVVGSSASKATGVQRTIPEHLESHEPNEQLHASIGDAGGAGATYADSLNLRIMSHRNVLAASSPSSRQASTPQASPPNTDVDQLLTSPTSGDTSAHRSWATYSSIEARLKAQTGPPSQSNELSRPQIPVRPLGSPAPHMARPAGNTSHNMARPFGSPAAHIVRSRAPTGSLDAIGEAAPLEAQSSALSTTQAATLPQSLHMSSSFRTASPGFKPSGQAPRSQAHLDSALRAADAILQKAVVEGYRPVLLGSLVDSYLRLQKENVELRLIIDNLKAEFCTLHEGWRLEKPLSILPPDAAAFQLVIEADQEAPSPQLSAKPSKILKAAENVLGAVKDDDDGNGWDSEEEDNDSVHTNDMDELLRI